MSLQEGEILAGCSTPMSEEDADALGLLVADAIVCKLKGRGCGFRTAARVARLSVATANRRYRRLLEEERMTLEAMRL